MCGKFEMIIEYPENIGEFVVGRVVKNVDEESDVLYGMEWYDCCFGHIKGFKRNYRGKMLITVSWMTNLHEKELITHVDPKTLELL